MISDRADQGCYSAWIMSAIKTKRRRKVKTFTPCCLRSSWRSLLPTARPPAEEENRTRTRHIYPHRAQVGPPHITRCLAGDICSAGEAVRRWNGGESGARWDALIPRWTTAAQRTPRHPPPRRWGTGLPALSSGTRHNPAPEQPNIPLTTPAWGVLLRWSNCQYFIIHYYY